MTRFTFVCCVNRPEVARKHLLTSPCVQRGSGNQLVMVEGMGSAGDGFRWASELAAHDWIVQVHQDVHLPPGWDRVFADGLEQARSSMPSLAAAGVYGIRADGTPAGRVFDRDRWLGSPSSVPASVRSLDELLLAVRRDSGLSINAGLGWHLYGTDLCLQAEAAGLAAVAMDAPCRHHSGLPRTAPAPGSEAAADLQRQVDAFNASTLELCRLWPGALPVVTPITRIEPGRLLELPGG